MHKKTRLALAVIAALALHAPAARAAPFCVEAEGLPADCLYHDLASCKQEAARKQGYCTVNKEEITLSANDDAFCTMDSSLVPLCVFQNGEDCYASAASGNAICFENSKTETYDPHHMDRALYQN